MADNFFPELPPRVGDEGGWPSSGSDYDSKVRYWLEAAFEEAKQEITGSDELTKVSKYVDYIAGRQWSKGRPSYKSAPIDNRIWRLLWELISIMTDIRPI